MTAPSYPPVIDPRHAKPIGSHESAYRAHLARVHVSLLVHSITMPTLERCFRMREDEQERRDAEGPVVDWQSIAEGQR